MERTTIPLAAGAAMHVRRATPQELDAAALRIGPLFELAGRGDVKALEQLREIDANFYFPAESTRSALEGLLTRIVLIDLAVRCVEWTGVNDIDDSPIPAPTHELMAALLWPPISDAVRQALGVKLDVPFISLPQDSHRTH
jgi:hypothetical protein